MQNSPISKFFVILLCMFFIGSHAYAQTKAEAKPLDGTQVPPEFKSLQLATNLVINGYETKSALSLAHAAKILKELNPQKFEPQSEEAASPTTTDSEKSKRNFTLDPEKLLADAASMAGDDAVAKSLIAQAKVPVAKSRGNVRGIVIGSGRALARSTNTYQETFRGNEDAVVTVIGDGDTDLDLYIYDMNGNLIVQDIDGTDQCVVVFYPSVTKTYRIVVRNYGNVYNDFSIGTN